MPSYLDPFIQNFLETDETGRRANFFGRLPQGIGPAQQDFLQGLFQPTFNRYLGALGRQALGGELPTQSFSDYLSSSFNPQKELLRAPQNQITSPRVVTPARFFFGR